MLYKGNHESQNIFLLAALDAFASGFTHNDSEQVEIIKIDSAVVERLIYAINENFPHIDGVDAASAFKKAANLITHIISMKPITGIIFSNDLEECYQFSHVLKDYNPNVVFALHLSIALIDDHSMARNGGEKVHAYDALAITTHSYNDILAALSSPKICPESHYYLIALLLEQIFYKTNPKFQYDKFFCGSEEYKDSCVSPPEHYAEIISEAN